MTNLKFLKTLTAGVALATALYPQAWAADTGDCGPNCQYTYDYETKTLNIKAIGEEAEFTKSMQHFGVSGAIKNVVVEEGIVKIEGASGAPTIWNDSGGGKLVLPASLKYLKNEATGSMKFATIEINSENLTLERNSFRPTNEANPVIVMNATSNINFTEMAFKHSSADWTYFPASLTISCKGNPEACLAKFGNSLDDMTGAVIADYYKQYDKDNNPIEIWNENGGFIYDGNGNVITKYDTNGNVNQYTYDIGGNLIAAYKNGVASYKRTSYTPAEAAAAVKKGNVNKVTLTVK